MAAAFSTQNAFKFPKLFLKCGIFLQYVETHLHWLRAKNSLTKSKFAKNDEFYVSQIAKWRQLNILTTTAQIELAVMWSGHLYCPCDDPDTRQVRRQEA